MSDLSDLYEEVILDHYRNPHHHGPLVDADRSAEGYNPLCGDRLKVFVRLDGNRIQDVSFEGSGCAISQASASIMTDAVAGRTEDEVRALFTEFQAIVSGAPADESMGEIALLAGVSQFPTRVKCATLGWHALIAALNDRDEPISTE